MNRNDLFFNTRIPFYIATWMVLLIFMYPYSCKQPEPNTVAIPAKALKQQQATIETAYTLRSKVLQSQNDSILLLLQKSRQEVQLSKRKQLAQRLKIEQRIGHVASDTLQRLKDCDSLQTDIQQYIGLVEAKDSATGNEIQLLQVQVANKDSALSACASYAEQLNVLTGTAIGQQLELEKQVHTLDRKLHRKQTLNKVLTGTLLILSGAMTMQLIH